MEKIIRAIKKAENIAVLTHISEDADALGAAAAFAVGLRSIGKKADIYISSAPESKLSFLQEKFIVFSEKSAIPDYDLCACVDSADFGRIKDRRVIFEKASVTVNIDHHFTNTEYADENFVESHASSAGEIIYSLLDAMGIEITKTIAEYLYISISSDSGCFKYSNTSPKTMRIAAELLEKGIDHAEICRRLFDTEKREIMRFKGYIMGNVHEYFNGRLCIVSVGNELFEKFGVNEKDTGDLVNIPRKIEGCEIAVAIRGKGEDVKISFRSNGKYDVAALAAEFDGGGHKMASGATIKKIDVESCEKAVVAAAERLLINDRI